MYHVIIKKEVEFPRIANRTMEECAADFFSNKRDVIRFIAEETGVTQKSIAFEIQARCDDIIKRDSLGWRAEIYFEGGEDAR